MKAFWRTFMVAFVCGVFATVFAAIFVIHVSGRHFMESESSVVLARADTDSHGEDGHKDIKDDAKKDQKLEVQLAQTRIIKTPRKTLDGVQATDTEIIIPVTRMPDAGGSSTTPQVPNTGGTGAGSNTADPGAQASTSAPTPSPTVTPTPTPTVTPDKPTPTPTQTPTPTPTPTVSPTSAPPPPVPPSPNFLGTFLRPPTTAATSTKKATTTATSTSKTATSTADNKPKGPLALTSVFNVPPTSSSPDTYYQSTGFDAKTTRFMLIYAGITALAGLLLTAIGRARRLSARSSTR